MKTIQAGVKDYLAMRRALGFKLNQAETVLMNFVSFLKEENTSHITAALIIRWVKLSPDVLPVWWTKRFRIVRLFTVYWKTIDSRSEVPPLGLFPSKYRRRAPHIYTEDEVIRLLKAANALHPHMSHSNPELSKGLRRYTFSTLAQVAQLRG